MIGAYQHSGPHQWADYEVEFIRQIGAHLGVAIQHSENLAKSHQQAVALQGAITWQRALSDVVSKIRSSLNIELILKTTCQELCHLLNLERIAIYRFNEDWSGQFISHFGTNDISLDNTNPFGEYPVWQDTHLQETQGGTLP